MSNNENILEKRKILILDDDKFMLDMLSSVLSVNSYIDIITENSAIAALKTLEGLKYDVEVIICDLQMPEMDGIQFLREISTKDFLGGVILLSGEERSILSATENLSRYQNLDILDVIKKPPRADQLLSIINGYKKRRQYRKKISLEKEITREEVEDAIRKNNLVFCYQPKVNIKNRKIVGAEALVRWLHESGDIVMPDSFIPKIEEWDLTSELIYSTFPVAMQESKKFIEKYGDFRLSLNISMTDLNSIALPDILEKMALENDYPIEHIVLEVTESRLMQNMVSTLDSLIRLRLKGFLLSIDDFGTGYSSMAQLKNIPCQEIKIDKMFVRGAYKDPTALAILRSSIELAKSLFLSTVCEGVEDETDWNLVESLGCDIAQGYYIAEPLAINDIGSWFESWEKT